MEDQEFTELIPGLPEEIALECLTRLHYSAHWVSSHVCRRWRRLLQSKGFYYQRKQTGLTRKSACLVRALPGQSEPKPRYGITLFDPADLSWERVDPVHKYPDGLPLFCRVASTEGKLVLMGGWSPSTWEPVRDVFVYEFTTRRWTQCADMPSTRSLFAIGAVGGRVLVAGGHDESKNALSSACQFDVTRNEWSELSEMSEERDECDGIVIGSEFWVVSGYGTDTQGAFKSSAEVYELGSGQWRRVSTAAVARGGGMGNSLIRWAEVETAAVQIGAGSVQSGCCVEI